MALDWKGLTSSDLRRAIPKRLKKLFECARFPVVVPLELPMHATPIQMRLFHQEVVSLTLEGRANER